jgi:hypothetical protein
VYFLLACQILLATAGIFLGTKISPFAQFAQSDPPGITIRDSVVSPTASPLRSRHDRPRPETGTHHPLRYEDCEQARLAGTAPIPQGAPGYRQGLDPDKDGIACESHETPGQTGESRR